MAVKRTGQLSLAEALLSGRTLTCIARSIGWAGW